jgi:hypothetical protein
VADPDSIDLIINNNMIFTILIKKNLNYHVCFDNKLMQLTHFKSGVTWTHYIIIKISISYKKIILI